MKHRFVYFGLPILTAIGAAIVLNTTSVFDDIQPPEVVRIPSGSYSYRPAGDFRIGTRVVDAPIKTLMAEHDFEIMKYHVSQAEYANCVQDGACYPSLSQGSDRLPQVGVSYIDATAYARWLSKETNQDWRLPTDAEWTRAAGDRFSETILGKLSNNSDPSKLWLEKYRSESIKRGDADPEVREIGNFGLNDLGLADINGNIWEWTESCFQNDKVSEDGAQVISSASYCGVRAAQGKHRAFIVEFVRDAKSGGCAVGVPPDNLGIRLVRDS